MFSFTIPEFVVICVGVAFVIILILFPSFRQQLKALAGGFLQVFVQDTAKTPDGARAIYAQKIDESTDYYRLWQCKVSGRQGCWCSEVGCKRVPVY